ncbi:hypothetical protein Bbelb_377290 [Branchiostoma belcheri]|nr:hypothetical protein Bbelb_377290 [Branchiostoma belcheri]
MASTSCCRQSPSPPNYVSIKVQKKGGGVVVDWYAIDCGQGDVTFAQLYEKMVAASEAGELQRHPFKNGQVGRGVEVYAGLQVGHACRQFGHFVRIEVDMYKTAASKGAEVPRPKSAFEPITLVKVSKARKPTSKRRQDQRTEQNRGAPAGEENGEWWGQRREKLHEILEKMDLSTIRIPTGALLSAQLDLRLTYSQCDGFRRMLTWYEGQIPADEVWLKFLGDQVLHEPTRGGNLLDLIATSHPAKCYQTGTLAPLGDSDHLITATALTIQASQHSGKRLVWLYDKADIEALHQDIATAPWDINLIFDSMDDVWDSWYSMFIAICERHIPHKLISTTRTAKPWIYSNKQIRAAIRRKHRLHSRAKRLNTEDAWDTYRRQRNLVTNLTRRAETVYIEDLVNDVETGNTRRFFTYAKSALGKTSTGIPALQVDSVILETPEAKANALNDFFINQTNRPSWQKRSNPDVPTYHCSRICSRLASVVRGRGTPTTAHPASRKVSYLSDRKQRVVIQGATSTWKSPLAGVPQGSVLGPTLFIIYINDLATSRTHCLANLFADDTSLSFSHHSAHRVVATLNRELSTVSTWLSTWKLEANIDKCKVMFITTRTLPQPIPPVTLGGTVLQVVTSHKHLGVTLTNTLSWSQHIEVISNKARRSSGLLCALRRKIPQNLLLRLYITITRPTLEYADIVWAGLTLRDQRTLESVQYQTARLISGHFGFPYPSYNSLYTELSLPSLQFRRKFHTAVTMYKLLNGRCPPHLQSLLPQARASATESRSDLGAKSTRVLRLQTAPCSVFGMGCLEPVVITRKVARRPFYQLYSIHAFLKQEEATEQAPPAFAMMSSKRTEDYKEVLQRIKETLPDNAEGPKSCVMDFELAIWQAVNQALRSKSSYRATIPPQAAHRIITVRERVNAVETTAEYHATEILNLQKALGEEMRARVVILAERYSRKADVVIRGILFRKDEICTQILDEFLTKEHLDFKPSIVAVYRPSRPSTTRPNPALLVRFVDYHDRDKLLFEGRKLRGKDMAVYEHLPLPYKGQGLRLILIGFCLSLYLVNLFNCAVLFANEEKRSIDAVDILLYSEDKTSA